MARERIVVDQMGYEVGVPHTPKRVVSLVPSQTELIDYLGCSKFLSGITKFCVNPSHLIKEKKIIGGTKNFRFDIIDDINPDLIIGNKEENYEDGINILKQKYPVWLSDITSLDDALNMIKSIGHLFGVTKPANHLVKDIQNEFKVLDFKTSYSALYFIWNTPKMIVGKETFIDVMLKYAGFINVSHKSRYPEITDDEIKRLNPDVIFLSSEPYPFKERHISHFNKIAPNARIKIVDGELFSWYGSRLTMAPEYFKKLHEDLGLPA